MREEFLPSSGIQIVQEVIQSPNQRSERVLSVIHYPQVIRIGGVGNRRNPVVSTPTSGFPQVRRRLGSGSVRFDLDGSGRWVGSEVWVPVYTIC